MGEPYAVMKEWGEGFQESSLRVPYVEYIEILSDFKRIAMTFEKSVDSVVLVAYSPGGLETPGENKGNQETKNYG